MADPTKRQSTCRMCGNDLPCIKCAIEYRRKHGLVGKEPIVREGDLDLQPEIAAATTAIREQGFTYRDHETKAMVYRKPWNEAEHRRRSGAADIQPMTTIPVTPVPQSNTNNRVNRII